MLVRYTQLLMPMATTAKRSYVSRRTDAIAEPVAVLPPNERDAVEAAALAYLEVEAVFADDAWNGKPQEHPAWPSRTAEKLIEAVTCDPCDWAFLANLAISRANWLRAEKGAAVTS